MITTCTTCGRAYEAGSEEQANEPTRFCFECRKRRPAPTQYQLDKLRRDQCVGIITEPMDGGDFYVAHVYDSDGKLRHTTGRHKDFVDADEAARIWFDENCNASWGVISLA